jgi:D-alanyl-lipoteichoic acid acyltransferase DltB (MBOAT superfamily)
MRPRGSFALCPRPVVIDWLEHLGQALLPGSKHPLFFNTVLFGLVFTVFYTLYVPLARWAHLRVGLLVAFSLWFYYRVCGWVAVPFAGDGDQALRIPFVGVMAFTAMLDWLLARQLAATPHEGRRRALLWVGVGTGLGILAFFKYAYFFADTLAPALGADAGPDAPTRVLEVVGLSYYTFKTVSYLLDVYNESLETPEPSYFHYLAYVSFFPAVMAGPIHRAEPFLQALRAPFALNRTQVGVAFFLFLTGVFKKLVIADFLGANYVNRIFDNPGMYTGFENLMGSFLFGIQLFADFSAYTDMALGVALLLGFELGPNFNEPFKACNITDFWRRWHISLSTWFNEYVYTPLAFRWRRLKRWGAVLAVVVTFVLSGLWHGPTWPFVLWGTAHGLAIGWETATRNPRLRARAALPTWLYDGISLVLTWAFLGLTYSLFKNPTLGAVGEMYGQIFYHFQAEVIPEWFVQYWRVALVAGFALVLVYLPTHWKTALRHTYTALPWPAQAVLGALLILLAYQVATAELQGFIYLRF